MAYRQKLSKLALLLLGLAVFHGEDLTLPPATNAMHVAAELEKDVQATTLDIDPSLHRKSRNKVHASWL